MRNYVKNIYLLFEEYLLKLKSKKDILFVVENELMLKYACLVYKRLQKDERLRLWSCLIYQERFRDRRKIKEQFTGKIVPYLIAKRIKWDLIFYPNHAPYFRADSPKIYIGHGLGLGKEVKGEDYLFGSRSLGENNEVIYEKIFRNSEFVKSMVKRHYPEFYPSVKVVGSLLGDQIMETAINKEEMYNKLNLDIRKKAVLIASTWGPNSLIQSRGSALVDQIPKLLEDYNVIMSIHPNNYSNVHYDGIDLEALLSPIKNYKNLYILKPEETGDSLLSLADLLITDFTSLGLYFPPFKRPIIFYDDPKMSYDLPSLMRELKKIAHVVEDISTLGADVREAFESFDQDKMEELAGKIFSYKGRAWQRHAEEIYESLHLDPHGRGAYSLGAFKSEGLSGHKNCRSILTNN